MLHGAHNANQFNSRRESLLASLAVLGDQGSGCQWWAESHHRCPVSCRRGSDASHPAGLRRPVHGFSRHQSEPQEQTHAGNLVAEESRIHQKDKHSEQTAATGAKRQATWWMERKGERMVTRTEYQKASVKNDPFFFLVYRSGQTHLSLRSACFFTLFFGLRRRRGACSCEPIREKSVVVGGGGTWWGRQREIKPGLCN